MKRLGIILLTLFLTGAAPNDARQANEAYRNGNYAEAEELYRKAIDADPDNAKLYFNLGNTLAEQGKMEEALRVFERFKTMADDPEQRAMADYNIGNLYIQAKKWDQAIESYKNALRYRAADQDAKHNFELALKKRQEQQQQNQNQQSQQDKQNRDQDQNQNQQQQNQNNQQQNQNQRQQNQNQSDQQQNRNQQQQQPRPQKISKQEAENILNALEQKEKELLKEFKKKRKTESSNSDNEKDW